MQDSNLQPPDQEIPGKASNLNYLGNFNGTTRVKSGQTGPQNLPLPRLKNYPRHPGIGCRTPHAHLFSPRNRRLFARGLQSMRTPVLRIYSPLTGSLLAAADEILVTPVLVNPAVVRLAFVPLPLKKCQRGGRYIASTDIDLDPFPMNRAGGKCLLSRRTWCICLLPSSANNLALWNPVWTEILAPLWKANAPWLFHHQFSFGARRFCPHSLVLQFLQAAGQALCRPPLQAH